MFKQLKVLKIQEIINLEMVKLVFLMKHDTLQGRIMDAFKKCNKGVGINKHRYNTRNKNTQNILPHSSELFNKSFFYVDVCQHFRNYKMEQRMQKI